MTPKEIKRKIIKIISQLFEDKGFDIDVIEHVNLIDDLGMDSITFIAIIVELESQFDIEVADDILLIDNFTHIDKIFYIIQNELLKKSKEFGSGEDVKA